MAFDDLIGVKTPNTRHGSLDDLFSIVADLDNTPTRPSAFELNIEHASTHLLTSVVPFVDPFGSSCTMADPDYTYIVIDEITDCEEEPAKDDLTWLPEEIFMSELGAAFPAVTTTGTVAHIDAMSIDES